MYHDNREAFKDHMEQLGAAAEKQIHKFLINKQGV